GPFLAAKDGDHRAVQIQNQTRAVVGLVDEPPQQPVIEAMQLVAKLGRCLQQKPAQRLRIGVAGQPRQVLKSAVGLQERRRLQTIQTQDNRVNQSQQYLRQTIPLMGSRRTQIPGGKTPPLQHLNEIVEEDDTAIVRHPLVIPRDFYISRRSAHVHPYFTKSEVRVEA